MDRQSLVKPPLVMGIVNVTPDSFSDGGRLATQEAALAHALRLIEQGADVLDIGGESTRPGSDPVREDEEIDRVAPLITALRARWDGVISIDTMKPGVARAAVEAGATMWNDVTALMHASDSLATAADLGCAVVLMHMKGAPKTMQDDPHYDDVVAEVVAHLAARAEAAMTAGVAREKIWLDPGIGFAKTTVHNLMLSARLEALVELDFPVLYATSRKRVVQGVDASAVQASDRLGGSLALALEGVRRGARMVRVHDVRETVQALKLQAAVAAMAPGRSAS
ncbi:MULTISPECIES: dihydropteroate synthase [unclassified Brevundimonas]|uniref:dihydropteroate synthase n=1 Tax=unclassified Brevundimonas TaxID=2622653 RepID=UPI000CFCFB81|nr:MULTISPECIES: dihydropteroate synthase [unclassified Brevundimonas]PRA27108.1 dihydropteroate synthase [Brevundimonas sp. MYb27]PQZ83801.1 dihydropteroate synthase [Brevundimonas sp. MYb31]PRB13134.1 dihydropteroate synthase [Brevundimonas sp. MYb52]PRB33759.1 dihydropteroate synthase [Brevundimonas sp. MYb46]PRB42507.1 dihydropteroate synthase [Brevundimonas sp. MYb33]